MSLEMHPPRKRRGDSDLRYWTGATACVHLGSGVAVLVLVSGGGRDMVIPLNEPFLSWPTRVQQANPATNYFATGTQGAGNIQLGLLIATFFLLSFLFQACAAAFWSQYSRQLETNRAALRWCEYGISASIMFVILFLLNGTPDLASCTLLP